MTAVTIRISAIIVTHNSMPILRECLLGLRAALGHFASETIVVDNNSTDHSASLTANLIPESRIFANRENRGFAAACNQGARAADGEFLLFINPDVIVDRDGVANLLDVFAQRDRIGLAGARLRSPDGEFHPTCRRFPTLRNIIFSRGSVLGRFRGDPKSGSPAPYTLPDFPQTKIVDAVAGTMVMVRRGVFEEIGGFDERFFVYMEDTDLSLRLSARGYANVFVPDAGGIHHWRQGSDAGRLRRLWYHHCSVRKYFSKHHRSLGSTVLLPFLLAANFGLALVMPSKKRSL